MREVRAMQVLNSPFCCSLKATYQDDDSLYMVTEFLQVWVERVKLSHIVAPVVWGSCDSE